MKKIICCILVLILMLSVVGAVCAQENIKVYVNNQLVEFDVQPRTINGRTMVPLRAIFEKLGAKVEWDGVTKTVTAYKENIKVSSTIGKFDMIINDEVKPIDVAPCEIDGRTLVPARFVAEAFNCDVKWEDKLQAVFIISDVENVKEKNDSKLQGYKENEQVVDFGIFANIEASETTKKKRNFRIYSQHKRLVDVYCNKYVGEISINIINEYVDIMEKNDYIKTIEELEWGAKENVIKTVLWDGENAVSLSYEKDKTTKEYQNLTIEFCVIKDYYSTEELQKIMIKDSKTAEEEKERIESELENRNSAMNSYGSNKTTVNNSAKIKELKQELELKKEELRALDSSFSKHTVSSSSANAYYTRKSILNSEIQRILNEIAHYEQ